MTRLPRAPSLLHEERHDDRHEGHQLRDHRQTFKKFPYHDESNVTRPALQFNACLAVARRSIETANLKDSGRLLVEALPDVVAGLNVGTVNLGDPTLVAGVQAILQGVTGQSPERRP